METTKKINEKGVTYQTNFMLDDVIESFEKRGLNNGFNDELIKELTIQKIEYGRMCIAHLNTNASYFLELDELLKNKILEVSMK